MEELDRRETRDEMWSGYQSTTSAAKGDEGPDLLIR